MVQFFPKQNLLAGGGAEGLQKFALFVNLIPLNHLAAEKVNLRHNKKKDPLS